MEIIKRLYVHFILKNRFRCGKISFRTEVDKCDLELKKQCLNVLKDHFAALTIKRIEKLVCNYFGQTPAEIHKKKRNRELVKSRQIIMYFTKAKTKMILKDIGAYFGQDHAMVLWAVKTIKNDMDASKEFKKTIEKIEKRL